MYNFHFYCYFSYCIIIIITTITTYNSSSNNSSGSSSTSSNFTIVIIISSTSINNISVLLTISLLFLSFHMFPVVLHQYTPPLLIYFREHNENKVKQLFCVVPAIAPFEKFLTSFQFSWIYILYLVNIRFTCDGEICLLSYLVT